MLAGPDSTLETMITAVATTLHALDAAAEVDVDLTKEDRKFLAAQRKKLGARLPALLAAKRAIEDYDLSDGLRLQARVELGDVVLDRGVSTGRNRAKLGLGARDASSVVHVFGPTVATLTKEKVALEPTKVLEAVSRLDDVSTFSERAGIAKDLTSRAKTQQGCLDDRDAGDVKRGKLVSKAVVLVSDVAHDLAAVHAALSGQFTRQKEYVNAFFYDTRSPSPKPTKSVPTNTTAVAASDGAAKTA